MSATITSDRANLKKRGTMLAYIFSNQGWGSFVGSLVVLIVLACYKSTMEHEGDTSKLDGGMNSVFSFIPPRPVEFHSPASVPVSTPRIPGLA